MRAPHPRARVPCRAVGYAEQARVEVEAPLPRLCLASPFTAMRLTNASYHHAHTRTQAEPLTRLNVVTKETTREGVPMPAPQLKSALDKTFVYLWIDHLGNRIYRATRNVGASPRRLQLWNPLVPDVSSSSTKPLVLHWVFFFP